MRAHPRSRRLLAWVLGRLPLGPYSEDLRGDLLEEFERTGAWAWIGREVVSAIGTGMRRCGCKYAVPLVFSVAWSALYPTWRSVGRSFPLPDFSQRWEALAWPYSSLMGLANAFLPALLFVWVGLLLYVMLQSQAGRDLNWFRTLLSLSTSLSVLLLSTMCLLLYLRQPPIEVSSIGREDFFSTSPIVTVSVPLALSLMSATLSVLSPKAHLSRV